MRICASWWTCRSALGRARSAGVSGTSANGVTSGTSIIAASMTGLPTPVIVRQAPAVCHLTDRAGSTIVWRGVTTARGKARMKPLRPQEYAEQPSVQRVFGCSLDMTPSPVRSGSRSRIQARRDQRRHLPWTLIPPSWCASPVCSGPNDPPPPHRRRPSADQHFCPRVNAAESGAPIAGGPQPTPGECGSTAEERWVIEATTTRPE